MSGTTVAPPSSTATSPPPASSAANSGGGGDGGTSKPLLFFVALGFGVVFTNLWIIVGVKYCFRYNHRARMMNNENGEPIDLNNMPRHRRRREKKLMSMEEVNERFPLTKYKQWRASRENEGLPAAGGVTAPASRIPSLHTTSRPASLVGDKALPRVSVEASEERRHRELDPPAQELDANASSVAATALDRKGSAPTGVAEPVTESRTRESDNEPNPEQDVRSSVSEKHAERVEENDEEDEDDPISAAVPAELLQAPGDACAICLDTLDDDDEIRGLTCGHAFHASCIDPWLTSRRACCPLCKADYYTPRPRPEGENAGDDEPVLISRRRSQANNAAQVTQPPHLWVPGRRGTAMFRYAGNTWRSGIQGASDGRHYHRSSTLTRPHDNAENTSRGFMGRLRSLPTPRLPVLFRRNHTAANTADAVATPGQLEAGTAR